MVGRVLGGLPKEAQGVLAAAATPVVARAVKSVPSAIRAATKAQVSTGALARTLGTAAVTLGPTGLTALAAAGVGSYFATRYIIDHFPTKARRLDAAADAYRRARRDMAASLGRALTAAEQQALAAHYKSVVADIKDDLF